MPKRYIKNAYGHLWMDKELLQLISRENRQRKKFKKFPNPVNIEKYKILRRLTKRLIKKKKKNYVEKLAKSLHKNRKRFWAVVKHWTVIRKNVTFLKNGKSYSTDKCEKANILNGYFHSVFNPASPDVITASFLPSTTPKLSDIQLSDAEVISVLRKLDPRKVCGPDKIPGRHLDLHFANYSTCPWLLEWSPVNRKRLKSHLYSNERTQRWQRITDQSLCCVYYLKY